MSKTVGIVEAPFANTPHANRRTSVALRRIAGASLVHWTAGRLTESQQLDQVVVLAHTGQQDEFARLLPSNIHIHASDHDDALSRFVACVERFDATRVVRVCVRNCFIDPEMVDRLVTTARAHEKCDYVSYCARNGQPAHAQIGVFAECIHAGAVRRASGYASSRHDRSDSTRFLYSHPELFQLRFIRVPHPFDGDDVRLTVNVEEDWDHVHTILDDLGTEHVDWQRIAGLLRRHPKMRRRMAALNSEEITNEG